jgi:hypothetical protein
MSIQNIEEEGGDFIKFDPNSDPNLIKKLKQ